MSRNRGQGDGKRFHTMNPGVTDLLKRMGMDEMYAKVRQLDEAAVLVEEGKLRRDVYDALVANVEASLTELSSSQNVKKKERGIIDQIFTSLTPAKETSKHSHRAGHRGGSKQSRRAHKAQAGATNLATTVANTEKALLSTYLYKRGKESLIGTKWHKRWCVLYPRALFMFKHKGDKEAKETVILTEEFFVSQSNGGQEPASSADQTEKNFDNESLEADESPKNKKELENTFILSDLVTRHVFSAKSADDRTLWIHTLMAALRKIMGEENYFPAFIDGPVRDPSQIQKDFEKRKEAYLKSKRQKTLELNKHKSFFGRTKRMTEAELDEEEKKWSEEGDEVARMELARKLLNEERKHVKMLEEQQRQREEELELARKHADEWREAAESNRQRFVEADAREKELNAQLQVLEKKRAQNIEKEEALKAQADTTQAQLESIQSKRRLSSHPSQLQDYEQQIKELTAKLAALQSALNVDLDGLDWDGTLEDAEEKMKAVVPRLMSDNPNESSEAQEEFDQWDKIIRNHADYKAREENKWKTWEAEQEHANMEALATMRNIVPREILTGVSVEFLQSRGLSVSAAKRVMNTKILQFLYMDHETIAKVHIADLSSRYIPQGLDIIELRAIYTQLPKEFYNDRDGSKKAWLETYRNKLFALTEKEAKGQLISSEQRHGAYRQPKALALGASAPPTSKKKKKKKKGKAAPVAKKMDTSKLENLFAGNKETGGGLPAGGPPAHVLAMMKKAQEAEKSSGSERKSRKSLRQSLRVTSGAGGIFNSIKAMLGGSDDRRSMSISETKSEIDAEDNAGPSKPTSPRGRGRQPMTEKQKLLAQGVRAQMDSVKDYYGVDMDDFDEKNAPAFDFGGDYSSKSSRKNTLSKQRAGEFSKNIETAMDELVKIVKEKGKLDQAEGGVATISFGQLFEEYENISDMLVGLLMRAKKRKLIKYQGDMLFQGIHDAVKITALI